VTRAIGVTVVVTTVAGALLPADEGDPIGNPLAVQGAIEALADTIANVGITTLFLAILLSAVSLLVRFRRAKGLQRQQLKWLAYGGGFLAAYILLDMISQVPPGLVDALIEALTFGALYVGVAWPCCAIGCTTLTD
jgi:two-component system, NarL family, sensor kinase